MGTIQFSNNHRVLFMKSRQLQGDDDDGGSWEDLPTLALVDIFCRTDFTDRLFNIPLVCKSWRCALDDPHCWSSMLPVTVSPEDVFIKMRRNLFPRYVNFHPKRLKTLIERSGGGSAVTSLYLQPFLRRHTTLLYHMFRLVANSCPNLKHISFHGFYPSYFITGSKRLEEAVLEIFNKCKRLELVDFGYSREFDSTAVIKGMGNHLPLLRGIRINGPRYYYDVPDCVAGNLPWLTLLSLSGTFEDYTASASLTTVLSKCVDLQYLNVSCEYDKGNFDQELIDQASTRIAELHWRDYSRDKDNAGSWNFCICWSCVCRRYRAVSDRVHGVYGESEEECGESDKERADDYEWYDDKRYSFKEERSDAFFQNRAKDLRRREFIFLKGCRKKCDLRRRSKCKPLTEYKLAYANDSYVIPVCR